METGDAKNEEKKDMDENPQSNEPIGEDLTNGEQADAQKVSLT
jgi:hypothetical protein